MGNTNVQYKKGDRIAVPNWGVNLTVGDFDLDKVKARLAATGQTQVCTPDEFIVTTCGEILQKIYIYKI